MNTFSKRHLLLPAVLLLLPTTTWASGSLPVISSVSPNNVAAGQVVSIAGSNFGSAPGQITLGGAEVTSASWSSKSISFAVPWTAQTGTNAVVVRTMAGSSAPATLNVQFVPAITSISPTIGLPFARVTVRGTGFGANTDGTVSFDGVAGRIVSWSDKEIVVDGPNGPACRGPVVVSCKGVRSKGITFKHLPIIYCLAQSPGCRRVDKRDGALVASTCGPPDASSTHEAPGVSRLDRDGDSRNRESRPECTIERKCGSFVIVGENFLTRPGTVTLNGVSLPIYSWSDDFISLPVPHDNCTGPIVVTTAYGASNAATLTIIGSTPGCIGSSPPTIKAVASPAPNTNGWNNSDVTVSFSCTAGSYPIKTCPAAIVVSKEGANQPISGTTTDTNGGTATASVSVSLDKTPPTLAALATTADGKPYTAGQWTNQSVTVTFACVDALSEIASFTQPVTVSSAGANQSVPGSCTDRAGNGAAPVTFGPIDINKTAPTIQGAVSPLPNAGGWNDTDVTVTWTCTSAAPPVVVSAPIVVNSEGTNQVVTGSCTDAAGNTATASVTVNIDKTPPTITAAVAPAPVGGISYGSATVTFICSDALSGVATCPAPITDATVGAGQVITGTATDKAGNSKSASVTLNIQPAVGPTITAAVSPAPNATGWNNSDVTVTFTCTPGSAPIGSCPSAQVVSTDGANQAVTGTATDAAGATATTGVVIKLDKTPPTVIPSTSPAPNASGWESSPVTVSFACSDSLSGVALCPSPTTISSDGANQTVPGTATDVAGNSATASANVNLEQTLPTIAASVSPAANPAGWNNTSVTVTFACTKSVSPIVSCSPAQTVSAQGVGQVVSGTVKDQAGNQDTTSVTLNIDGIPPTIVQFTAPSQLSPGQSGSTTVTVNDSVAIASVVFELSGAVIGTVLAPPYGVDVSAPSDATSGSTLTLTAVVTDVAGNVASANKGIQVVSSGVIVGQVLSDETGLPLAGAGVQVVGQTGQSATSDSLGRYSIPVTSSQVFLSISQPGNSGSIPAMVTVDRQVAVQPGVGTVPVDARLTSIASPTTITDSGGTVGTGAITVTVPAGDPTTLFSLTPLSQQGLPGLLPLGWSPVAAFDLRTDIPAVVPLSANFTGLPAVSLNLVSYSYTVHAWTMVTPSLSNSSGSLSVPLPSTGDYALVAPDAGNANIQLPAAGQPLTGVPMVALPSAATGSGSLSPANIAPSGGTAMASLVVQSATPLPSGTVIRAEVTEKYTLTSGQLISEEPRYEDILLYQAPAPSDAALAATFPVTPSRTFQASQLVSGDVHLDILAGRESARGETGGSDAASVQSGDATLTVSAGSLPQDTVIAVNLEALDSFLPSTSGLVPLSEYRVDFSGAVLSNAAQLSVGVGTAAPGSNVVVAKIQRVGGVPFLVVVSVAQVTASGIVSQATPGLPGIREGGDYVFYEVTVPTGFVSGTVSASSGPVAAMIQTDGLPFVAFSSSNGGYMVLAAAGTVNLTASIPSTALAGTAVVQVTVGQTATANLTVVGQVESAAITPANGAVGVPLTAEIDIRANDAFNPASVTSSSVVLTAAGSSAPVALRFVFSAGNTKLAAFPLAALQPSTQYTLLASGLANTLGGLISVPATTFTTAGLTPPTYSTTALVFGMPGSDGNVEISAPAGSFPPGMTILIVDQSNGVVYSLTVFNDGSVSGQMPATINDTLQVTLTDPQGNKTTFTISQFVAPDGTTAVGPGGGTVTGPGGTAIIIPQGALSQGATFKLALLDESAFPQLPSWPGVNFGSGMQITAPSMPTFNKEAKLAFPVPANAPPGAFYYVYRRLTDKDDPNNVLFETIDHAFVQGTGANAQVVTASPPFCGYMNSYGNFQSAAAASFNPLQAAETFTFMMWDYDPNQAGVASQGLIEGRVYQSSSAGFVPLASGTSVSIWLTNNPQYVTITSATCGTYSLFDPRMGGGPRSVTAQNGTTGQVIVATANEVNGIQPDDSLFSVTAGLEAAYRNIGRLNFTFAPAQPPPPPPQVSIQLFTLDQNGHRVPANGILQTGTNLIIAFQSALTVQSASIGAAQLAVETPDSTDGEVTDNLPERQLLSARVQGLYALGAAGTYSITATALNPLSQAPVAASQSILVVAAGGGNTAVKTCTAAPPPADPTSGCSLPTVVGISPANTATGVSPNAFPEVTFDEPVTNVIASSRDVPGNVVLADATGAVVPIHLVGIRAPDSANPGQNPIASPVEPSDVITSLTIEPINGLEYNQTYTLTLNAGAANGCLNSSGHPDPQQSGTTLIIDQNQAPTGPLCLQPFPKPGDTQPYSFTTFGPQPLGGVTSQYGVVTRPVIIGQTAYAGEMLNSVISGLGMFNISDPSNPADLGLGADFVGRAIDIAGVAQSPVTGGGLVAISAGMAMDNQIPGNVWLYDVSSPTKPTRVGAISVSSDVTAGIALRLFMKEQYLYASTFMQGLQVIDLGQAIAEYQQTPLGQFGAAVTTAGDGFAMDTIVNTIQLPLTSGGGGMATMFDLKADDFSVSGGGTQTLLVATGQLPFVMADPFGSGSSAVLYPASANGSFSINPVQPLLMTSPDGKTNSLLCYGHAVALGTIPVTDDSGNSTSEHIAVVVGNGGVGPASSATSCAAVTSGAVLAVVNVSETYDPGQPLSPQLIGLLPLPTTATDVALNGTVALVSTGSNVLLVNLQNPSQPVLAGQITGNFGNWLATTSAGLIVGTSSTTSRISTSSLGVVPQITVTPTAVIANTDGLTSQALTINYSISGSLSQVSNAWVTISNSQGNTIYSTPVPIQASGQVVWPAGQPMTPTPNDITFQVYNPDGGVSPPVTAGVELSTGAEPTPVLTSVTPASALVGGTGVSVTLAGRNFLPSSAVRLTQLDNQSALSYSPQFISKTQLAVQLPDTVMQRIEGFVVQVSNGNASSNNLTFDVVPQGLPPAPVLTSISPSQLPSSLTPTDTSITIDGSNFIRDDTEVITSSIPAKLDMTLVSSTQIQATVPAWLLSGPSTLTIQLASASVPYLKSQSLPLQILNDVGDPVLPAPVEVNSVNDGFVSLPAPAANQPTTITVAGNGFQPGAQIFAMTDTAQQALATTVVSSSELQAQIPTSLWSEQDFMVTFNIDPVGDTQHASQAVLQAKVTFDKAKNPNTRYACDNCTGYHRRALNKIETYYLMVPVKGANTATAETTGKDSKAEIAQGQVGLVVEQPSLARPASGTLTAPKQVVTVNGLGEDPKGLGTSMNAAIRSNSQKLGTLHLQPVRARKFDVYLHFVAAVNKKGKPTNVSDKLKSNRDTLVSGLQNTLNDIFGSQANVSFKVFPVVGDDAQLIDYDANKDGKLTESPLGASTVKVNSNDEPVSDCPAASTETYMIMNALVPSNTWINDCSPPNDSAGNPTMHIVFVKSIADVPGSSEPGTVVGYTAGNGTPFIFVQDDVKQQKANTVVAHEVGHALGMHHNAEKCTLKMVQGQATFTCTMTDNRGITATTDPTVDSDFIRFGIHGNSAADSLMWYDGAYQTTHIGWPSLDEMNRFQLRRNQ